MRQTMMWVSALALTLATHTACSARLSAQDADQPGKTSSPNSPTTNNAENNLPQQNNNTPTQPTTSTPDTAPQPLRRISAEQYHQILSDTLPEPLAQQLIARSLFPATLIKQGFSTDAAANSVNKQESNNIEDNAERMSTTLLEDAANTYPQTSACVPQGFSDADLDRCVPSVIQALAPRLYRRPLTEAEQQLIADLYETVRLDQGSRVAWAAMFQLLFQAPALLYRTERGDQPAQLNPELLTLTDWELASRLSFFFLNSGPDDELWRAAQAGQLHTPAQIEAQARRLVKLPRVQKTLGIFHRDWLKLYTLQDAERVELTLDAPTRDALLHEAERLLADLIARGDGNLTALFESQELPVAAPLKDLYGVDQADGSAQHLPDRRGLLSTVSFMMTHAKTDATNPIERGAFLLRDVLCVNLPVLPGGIDTQGPLMSSAHLPTARQRLAPLMERNDCSGCHVRINPPGLAMESYDHLGRFRTQEQGEALDTAGQLREGSLDFSFNDTQDMFSQLASTRQLHDCYAKHWLRFATGRLDTQADAHTLKALSEAFWDTQGDLSELLVQLTQTEAFLYRRPHPAPQE